MGNFVRVCPSGWATKVKLTSAQANALELDNAKAINGDDGGSWAPAIPIALGGAGIHVTGPSQLDDIVASTLKATLTLYTGLGLIDVQSGSHIEWQSGGSALFTSGSFGIWY